MSILLFLGIFVPGFLIALGAVRKQYVVLFATPLSLSLYVLLITCLAYLGQTTLLIPLYSTVSMALLLVVGFSSELRNKGWVVLKESVVIVPMILIIVIYHSQVGAFIDHGVDAFRHMALGQNAYRHLVNNNGELRVLLEPGSNNFVFHNITALYLNLSGLTGSEVAESLSLVYSIIWSISLFLFISFMLRGLNLNGIPLIGFCYFSVFLYWLAYGINNFSFPRAYFAGPAILNFTIYFVAFVLMMDWLKCQLTLRNTAAISTPILVAGFLHPQEIVLLIAFLLSASAVVLISWVLRVKEYAELKISNSVVMTSGIAFIIVIALVFAAIYKLPKYPADPISLLSLGEFFPGFSSWSILRPNHQFFTVLGYWGLYTFVLIILFFRHSIKSLFVIANFIYPLVTVFNPVFAEALMKAAYPQVLWRALLGIHLPIVLSYLIWSVIFQKKNRPYWRHIICIGAFLPSLVLLFPIKIGSFENTMVRFPSLTKTPIENSYKYWIDLIEFLQDQENARLVLTDPVTGYAIRSLTKHISGGKKFFPRDGYINFNFESYQSHPLKKYRGRYIVVNQRDGVINQRLKPPYHIYPDIMKVSKYYSAEFLEEVSSRSDRYQKIWASNLITVYSIL